LYAAGLLAQVPTTVEINVPSLNANRYVNLDLSGYSSHGLAVYDHGAQRETNGFFLARFIETAGWAKIDDMSRYLVRIDGEDTFTLPLSEVLRGSLKDRVWLVTDEAPSVAVAGSDGVGDVKVRRVRRIRVTDTDSQQQIDDVDFGRLSLFENEAGNRILWKEYLRIDAISVLILTCSVQGRHEKLAVLLSKQVGEWSERRRSR
jgi:hypothetical protein